MTTENADVQRSPPAVRHSLIRSFRSSGADLVLSLVPSNLLHIHSYLMKIRLLPIAAAAIAGCAGSQPDPAPAPQPIPAASRPANGFPQGGIPGGAPQDTAGRALGGAGGPPAAAPRPYNRVITSDAKTRRGLFSTHRVGDRLYFEIPAKELAKDQLIVGRYTRAAAADPNLPGGGFGSYGGDQFSESAARWERNGNRLILRAPS